VTGTQTNRLRALCGVSLALTLTLTLLVIQSATARATTTPNLQSLIVQSGDIPGLELQTPSTHDLRQLIDIIKAGAPSAAAAADVAHLRKDGLIAERDAALGPSSPSGAGTTQVWYFKSPGSATSYSSYEVSAVESGSAEGVFQGNYKTFNTGVAGARSLVANLPSDPSTKTPSVESAVTYVRTGHCVVLITLTGSASAPLKLTSLEASAARQVETRDKRACE